MSDPDTLYGFTALPADQDKTRPSTTSPNPVSVSSLAVPSTPLAKRLNVYAETELPPDTYRHSLRVYSYGLAIARECFPQFNVAPGSKLEETWFLTAMLHDIGTAPQNIANTKLSYEFWAGVEALRILQHPGSDGITDAIAPLAQAESVAEAIIRHQDVQDKGSITLMTRLIHLGTLMDNIGAGADLVHPDTIRNVNEAYDRKGWSGCFERTVHEEKKLKPWAMVSRIEGFEEAIRNNGSGLMNPWN